MKRRQSTTAADKAGFARPRYPISRHFLSNPGNAVFSILIANALDALSEGGKITVYNETADDFCKIYISDTGSGISPDDMPHIFNPFFSTKPDGAGIDLATAKRVMDSHGGRIEVTSNEEKGTTFTLFFPLERRHPLRTCPLEE